MVHRVRPYLFVFSPCLPCLSLSFTLIRPMLYPRHHKRACRREPSTRAVRVCQRSGFTSTAKRRRLLHLKGAPTHTPTWRPREDSRGCRRETTTCVARCERGGRYDA